MPLWFLIKLGDFECKNIIVSVLINKRPMNTLQIVIINISWLFISILNHVIEEWFQYQKTYFILMEEVIAYMLR